MKLLSQLDLNEIKIPTTGNAPIDINSPLNLGQIIAGIMPWIFTIAGMLLLMYLIFGGIQLMLSQGDPKNAQAAKAHITNALIGFIIIFIAYWVVQLLGIVLGLNGPYGITNVFKSL
jgi:hypothetical protein